ncbi:MAG: hypothetical protein AABZ50_08460 [Pseudomonadota bacterium]
MRYLWLPALLLTTLVVTSCGRAPVTTRPALPTLERPTLALQANPEQLRIPRAALVERGGIPGVFVLDSIGEARFRMVRPGHADGDRLIILAGLHGNETLVLGDLRDVRDGSPVKPVETADKRR